MPTTSSSLKGECESIDIDSDRETPEEKAKQDCSQLKLMMDNTSVAKKSSRPTGPTMNLHGEVRQDDVYNDLGIML